MFILQECDQFMLEAIEYIIKKIMYKVIKRVCITDDMNTIA